MVGRGSPHVRNCVKGVQPRKVENPCTVTPQTNDPDLQGSYKLIKNKDSPGFRSDCRVRLSESKAQEDVLTVSRMGICQYQILRTTILANSTQK